MDRGEGGGTGKRGPGVALFVTRRLTSLLVVGRIEREFLFRAARQIVVREVENITRQW